MMHPRPNPATPSVRSAERGFTPSLRSAEHGFTLVEMLIALSIFAMLSVAGVMLLRSSIDTQHAVADRLDDAGGIARLRAMLSAELSSAQPRPHRDASGQPLAALTGDGSRIDFVFAATAQPGAPALARASYALENGDLVRRGSRFADGALADEGAAILHDVRAISWRYRGLDGQWVGAWAPDTPSRLPRAVELTIDSAAAPNLVLRFAVAPDGVPPPGSAQADAP